MKYTKRTEITDEMLDDVVRRRNGGEALSKLIEEYHVDGPMLSALVKRHPCNIFSKGWLRPVSTKERAGDILALRKTGMTIEEITEEMKKRGHKISISTVRALVVGTPRGRRKTEKEIIAEKAAKMWKGI